jgi:hypothetical protein
MSKIGRVNLELQEQANELGYDTVQEAIADGWEANEIAATLTKKDELEKAHEAWLKEKKKVLGYIRDIQDMLEDVYQDENLYKKAVEVAKFIEWGEV